METKPPFWLQVRKEYVIDNIEGVLSYMHGFSRLPLSRLMVDPDYQQTVDILHEITDEYLARVASDSLVRTVEIENEELYIRIAAAYILAAHQQGSSENVLLSRLMARLTALLHCRDYGELLFDFQMLAAGNHTISSTGYSWVNLQEGKFSIEILFQQLLKTKFAPRADSISLFYESKGVALVENDRMNVALCNLHDYRVKQSSVQPWFNIGDKLDFSALREDKLKANTIEQLMDAVQWLPRIQDNVHPSPSRRKQTYDLHEGDVVTVRITSNDVWVRAETVDPSYEKIEGQIYIHSSLTGAGVPRDTVVGMLRPGELVEVTYQQDNPRIPFRLLDAFQDYYEGYKVSSVRRRAVMVREYSLGYRWLTEDGNVVSVMGKEVNDNIRSAIENNQPVYIREVSTARDSKGNFAVNGMYADGEECEPFADGESYDSFRTEAYRKLVRDYLDDSRENCVAPVPEEKAVPLDMWLVRPLVRVLYLMSVPDGTRSSPERMKLLAGALVLARMCGATDDEAFLRHDMDYMKLIISFARCERISDMQLRVPESLAGNPVVEEHRNVARILSQYRLPESGAGATAPALKPLTETIENLVKSSNSLVDMISEEEIYRIHRNIVDKVHVSDLYNRPDNSRVFYGQESMYLEFKTSAFFPPYSKGHADPALQKWNILKAVCAMLNSTGGGDVLIGVNDDGYSNGLADDLRELSRMPMYSEGTVDKFQLYVKYLVDNAFVDKDRPGVQPRELAAGITFTVETEDGGNQVLRIRVSPYRMGIVSFRDTESLPGDFAESYTRSSNTSLPLTPELEASLRDRQRRADDANDSHKAAVIQRAILNKRAVRLIGLITAAGKEDCIVEPYRLLEHPDRLIMLNTDVHPLVIESVSLTRFAGAETVDRPIKTSRRKNLAIRIDIFGSPETGTPGIAVTLSLGMLPYTVMRDIWGVDGKYFTTNTVGSELRAFPMQLTAELFDLRPLARFCLSYPGAVRIREQEAREGVKALLDGITG